MFQHNLVLHHKITINLHILVVKHTKYLILRIPLAGILPASRINRRIRSMFTLCVQAAADTTFSSIMVLPKSLQPKLSVVCQPLLPSSPMKPEVRNIVDHQPAYSECLQVLIRPDFICLHVCVVRLECPRNECQKSGAVPTALDAFVLCVAHSDHMQHPLLIRLAKANNHRSRSRHADAMSGLMMSIQSRHEPFCLLIFWRIRSTRISAPAPGKESSPASCNRRRISSSDKPPETSFIFIISAGEKECIVISKRFLISFKIFV